MLVESFSGTRGIYGKDITEDLIDRYAGAFAEFLKKKGKDITVVVGADTRPSSEKIKKQMAEVFASEGFNVIDAGFNTTPAVQLGVRHFKANGGVMITASHNEPEWNGWKILSEKGSMLRPEDIAGVIKESKKDYSKGNGKGKITDKEEELKKAYSDFVFDAIGHEGIEAIKKAGLNIVIDPNGGAALAVIEDILKRACVKYTGKNMKTGVFERLIEPNEKSLAYLSMHVNDLKADLGAGWDCDGDRVEIVLPDNTQFTKDRGTMLSGQYILALLADEILSGYKGDSRIVVVNDATSNIVHRIAEKNNAEVVEVEVGEINVVEKMDELKAPVGGEGSSSGGIFPPSRCRDGIITLMILLRMMAMKKKKMGELLEEYPRYYNSSAKMQCPGEHAADMRRCLEKHWKKQEHIKEIRKTGDETGGLKIIREKTKEGEGWIWFRASKTEAGVFRIISDAESREHADKLLAMGEKSFNDCLAGMRK